MRWSGIYNTSFVVETCLAGFEGWAWCMGGHSARWLTVLGKRILSSARHVRGRFLYCWNLDFRLLFLLLRSSRCGAGAKAGDTGNTRTDATHGRERMREV